MLLALTPNVALDRTLIVRGFTTGGVFRAESINVFAGGKGLNVARAARTLGAQARCFGWLGGNTGHSVADLAAAEGLDTAWTPFDGETRTCISIVNPDVGGETTQINEQGVPVTADDWRRLTHDVAAYTAEASALCVCGSLPPKTDQAHFSAFLGALTPSVPVWVDTSGVPLKTAIEAVPYGIKVNQHELGDALGQSIDSPEEALQAAEQLHGRGISIVVVTLGGRGAVLVSGEARVIAQPPPIHPLSTVGSGDSFLAGLMVALERGQPHADALRAGIATGSANALTVGAGKFDLADVERLTAQTRVTVL